jgi:gamma-glutamyltranspeptidase / glutathione hydrolase
MAPSAAVAILIAACGEPGDFAATDGSPASDREDAPVELIDAPDYSASTAGPMVAATSGYAAIAAGLDVLREGGSAMDAALTVALDQIVLSAGSWNSAAGILGLVYYDAESDSLHGLHAGYRTFAGEDDPDSIPSLGTPSGRTALVGGFMAGVQAGHDRFGSLPFERLFEPAIAHAENGLVVSSYLATLLKGRADVLARLPETRAIYFKPDGAAYEAGDVFRQPALAETLRQVADRGANVMYTGAWAQAFVEAVRAEGGEVTLDDLADYEAIWAPAECAPYSERRVCTLGPRDVGGAQLLEALRLSSEVGLPQRGMYLEDAESLYWLARVTQVGPVLTYAPEFTPDDPSFLVDALPGVTDRPDGRVAAAQAAALRGHIDSGQWDRAVSAWAERAGLSTHSDAVVVVDDSGNWVALTHSINTTMWGTTGINVAGVSIPDSASFQQGSVRAAGPGEYMPTALNPAIVLDDTGPVLAASTIGNVHYAALGRLHLVLDHDMSPTTAVETPALSGVPYAETLPPGAASPEVLAALEARGYPIREHDDVGNHPFWIGISKTGSAYTGAVTPSLTLAGGTARGL